MSGVHIHINAENGGGGGGGGQAAELAVSTTLQELRALRDNGGLIAGQWYRITDYRCSTQQEGTLSAAHQFDVIVRASDASHLNENAFAAHHEGDTYFQDCNLEAWELKYCLDNDTNRFAWADDTQAGAGCGVIYYMKDEWGNEAGYDFKNILFACDSVDPSPEPGGGSGEATRDGDPGYCYTFTWVDENGVIKDASIVCQTMYTGDGTYMGVTGNVIKDCYLPVVYEGGGGDEPGPGPLSSIDTRGMKGGFTKTGSMVLAKNRDGESGSLKRYLPFNLFINKYEDVGGNYCFGCCSNVLGEDCMFNTFGTWCSFNTFSQDCCDNQFSQGCFNNQFSQGCYGNSFSQNCSGNSFSQRCSGNSFSQNCQRNTFSQGCQFNQFSQECCNNTFSQYCESNQFSQGCYDNQFSQYCSNNTFSQDCSRIVLQAGVGSCEITGSDGTVLSGVNGVTVDFSKNGSYAQFAAFRTSGTLRIWNPADDSVS